MQGNQLLVIAETDYKMKYAALRLHSMKILNYFRPELKDARFVFCQGHQSFQDVLEDQGGEYDTIDEMTLDADPSKYIMADGTVLTDYVIDYVLTQKERDTIFDHNGMIDSSEYCGVLYDYIIENPSFIDTRLGVVYNFKNNEFEMICNYLFKDTTKGIQYTISLKGIESTASSARNHSYVYDPELYLIPGGQYAILKDYVLYTVLQLTNEKVKNIEVAVQKLMIEIIEFNAEEGKRKALEILANNEKVTVIENTKYRHHFTITKTYSIETWGCDATESERKALEIFNNEIDDLSPVKKSVEHTGWDYV